MNPEPPAADEMEVSIFGPGKGEAVAVHVQDGRWLTVDSCRTSDGTLPVQAYLAALKVDIASQVDYVVATHAHDDHMAGIADFFSLCASAAFVTPAATTDREFTSLLATDEAVKRRTGTSVREEFRRVFDVARDQRRRITRASEMTRLYDINASVRLADASVMTLSPSDAASQRALEVLAQTHAQLGEYIRPDGLDLNSLSIALWVETPAAAVLLGGDLLKGPTGCGWRRIIDFLEPENAASLIKVPHHGSENADLPAAWTQLLAPLPVSLLTPYRAGVSPIPKPGDLERIAAKSSQVAVTAKTSPPTLNRRQRMLAGDLATLGSNIRNAGGKIGQVQARRRPGESAWRVAVQSPAYRYR
ncbi:MBL fold metallo-hydrolase [Jannaschia sp. R86511]|uniref:MBL fold metallo-hydrolase n=1 Tax=Jannaschia sp. R86511 TaxID=3093853 RepID=UPI0036D3A93C